MWTRREGVSKVGRVVNDRKGFLLLRPQPQFGRNSYGKLRPQANCNRKSELRPNETIAAEVNNCGRKRVLRPQHVDGMQMPLLPVLSRTMHATLSHVQPGASIYISALRWKGLKMPDGGVFFPVGNIKECDMEDTCTWYRAMSMEICQMHG